MTRQSNMKEYIISSGSEWFYLYTFGLTTDKQNHYSNTLPSPTSNPISDIHRTSFSIMPISISKGFHKLKKASIKDNLKEDAKSKANRAGNQSTKQPTSSTMTENEVYLSNYSSMAGPRGHEDHVNNSRNGRTGGSGSSRQRVIAPCLTCARRNATCDYGHPICGPCMRDKYVCYNWLGLGANTFQLNF